MKPSRIRRLLSAGTLCLAGAMPAGVAAQVPLTLGNWSTFEWFDGVGAVDGSGFSLNAGVQTTVRVTDSGFTGDAFDIFVNGSPFASTPSVAGGIATGAFDGDAAWADPRLSKTSFVLGPGSYVITLAVREAGSGFLDGEGFIRADPSAQIVPEPGSVLLVLTGLAVLAPVARRRMRR